MFFLNLHCFSANQYAMKFIIQSVLLISIFVLGGSFGSPSLNGSLYHPSVIEDGQLSMPGLLKKYEYPAETHTVQTEDGYILTLFRIPYGRKCGLDRSRKSPVLYQHGLLSSSFDMIILGPKKSLAYILADNCYDVWLGNNRGNSQSKKHITMSPKQKEFWRFTWHEMGKYDLPSMIDYILNVTGQPNLHYVGHSQGTTQFFVFGALRPEYHRKIKTMHALSPVVYMKNLASPLVRVSTMFYKSIEVIAELIGLHEFLPNEKFLNSLGAEFCRTKYPNIQIICSNVFFLLCGFDEAQLNKTILPAIIGHTPAGASSKQLVHYAQGIRSGKFRQFDFGIWKNLAVYNSIFPPEYDLTKINIPIALYYASNDWMAAIKDVKALEQKLPNIIEKYHVPYSKFNHLDFIFATDGDRLVYDRVLEVLDNYSK